MRKDPIDPLSPPRKPLPGSKWTLTGSRAVVRTNYKRPRRMIDDYNRASSGISRVLSYILAAPPRLGKGRERCRAGLIDARARRANNPRRESRAGPANGIREVPRKVYNCCCWFRRLICCALCCWRWTRWKRECTVGKKSSGYRVRTLGGNLRASMVYFCELVFNESAERGVVGKRWFTLMENGIGRPGDMGNWNYTVRDGGRVRMWICGWGFVSRVRDGGYGD